MDKYLLLNVDYHADYSTVLRQDIVSKNFNEYFYIGIASWGSFFDNFINLTKLHKILLRFFPFGGYKFFNTTSESINEILWYMNQKDLEKIILTVDPDVLDTKSIAEIGLNPYSVFSNMGNLTLEELYNIVNSLKNKIVSYGFFEFYPNIGYIDFKELIEFLKDIFGLEKYFMILDKNHKIYNPNLNLLGYLDSVINLDTIIKFYQRNYKKLKEVWSGNAFLIGTRHTYAIFLLPFEEFLQKIGQSAIAGVITPQPRMPFITPK